MILQIDIQGYVLKIDNLKTKAYYENVELYDCSCSGCRNFQKNIERSSSEVKEFFLKVGIHDLTKSIEIIPYNTEKSEKVFYQSIYHICGKIIMRPKQDKEIKMDENLSLRISDTCDLLDKKFPAPSFQITIETRLPWIISDKNTY